MSEQKTTRRKDAEAGYTLVAVMFLLFLLTLSLSVAVPRVARDLQLDRERENWHRGMQYRRAIQLYYRKFHAYPPTVDALVKTQEIRFLRRKYVDLSTGKDEWKLIHYGQAKTATLGFFGQPLAGAGSSSGSSVLSGTGPSDGNSSSSLFGNSATSSSSMFSSSASSTDTSASTSGTSTSGSASSTGTSGSSSLISGSSFGSSSGNTFGGLGIIGVSPMSPNQSILLVKKKNHYNEWEFVYDPLSDAKTISGGSATTANSASTGTSASTFGSFGSSSSSSSSSSSILGGSTSSGSTGTGSTGTQ
jgi:type II secretory pathway pseudopilin PulG